MIGGGGYVDVDVVAVDTGSQTRVGNGTILEFVSPPAGVNTRAEVQTFHGMLRQIAYKLKKQEE